MKLTRKIFAVFVAGLISFAAAAQSNPVGEFAANVATSRVAFDYSYVMTGARLNIHGDGSVIAQEDSYCLEGNGLKVWCDGSSVWTMDVGAAEVVIEPAESANGLTVNPVILVMNVDKTFTWDMGRPANLDGKQCMVYSLTPVAETDFENVKFYMAGSSLVGVSLETGGVSLTFTISNMEFLPSGDVSIFSPGAFSSDCIITDLR